MPAELYEDSWVTCTETHVVIRGYYFPTGAPKSIRYTDIRSVSPVEMGALTGRWRLWGSSSLRQWWHLDPGRHRKKTALILDLGRRVKPAITPVDTTRVKEIIEAHRT